MPANGAVPLKIVLLGGGTGSFELLLGLKELTPDITAVVNMCDDGGSTGRLRAEYGVLPPGDVRQCLVALGRDQEQADLFSYRFDKGSLAGHAAGNLILAALEIEHNCFAVAVEIASHMLAVTGRVVPVSLESHGLVMQDGAKTIRGQEAVRLHTTSNRDVVVKLEPVARLNPLAARAIHDADIVVIAPGGLYWTLLPMCAVQGVSEALQTTTATVFCVANLMNRPEQHQDWHVVDYIREFERYIGEGTIDTVLYNTQPMSPELLANYAMAHEAPVATNAARFSELQTSAIGAELIADAPARQDAADHAIRRTLIRHDGRKVAKEIIRLYHKAKAERAK